MTSNLQENIGKVIKYWPHKRTGCFYSMLLTRGHLGVAMHAAPGITQPSMWGIFMGSLRNGLLKNGNLFVLLGSFPFFPPENKSLSAQEKEDILNLRKKELDTLEKEKTYVDSLLKLCGRVKDLIKGDILSIKINKIERSPGEKGQRRIWFKKTYHSSSHLSWKGGFF